MASELHVANNCRRGMGFLTYCDLDQGSASTVILRTTKGFQTPPPEDGVLPGTTQAQIFTALEQAGQLTIIGPVRAEELHSAQALWLVSSGRMVVPIHTLDEMALTVDRDATSQFMTSLTSM